MNSKMVYPFLLSIFIFVIHSSYATSLYPVLDRHWVKEADFIFVGTVVDISYHSYPSAHKEEAPIPHTLVTCTIEEILKGSTVNPKQITLRFVGGPTQDGSDRVLYLDGIPLFDLNDRGVFFVRDNGKAICPLVGWQQGFTRSIKGKVYNNTGTDYLLIGDPIYAARIHPMDIRDYDNLLQTIKDRKRNVDQLIYDQLSEETLHILQYPDQADKLPPHQLRYTIPAQYQAPFDIAMQLLPIEFRSIPKNVKQALLYRDLNRILTQRHLFSQSILDGITLRKETITKLNQDQKTISIPELCLLNRRVLEDIYPVLITKSMDQTIIKGHYQELPEIMINTIGDKEFQIVAYTSDDGEMPKPQPDPLPQGQVMDEMFFLGHISDMVGALHTQEELSQLPAIQSASINDAFVVPALAEVGEQQ